MKHLAIHCGVFLLTVLGGVGNALAHDASGSLGIDPTVTDYLVITCNDDGSGPPDHLAFELNAGRPATAPTVSAQIQIPDQQVAMSVTDPVNGDSGSSRTAEVRGGATTYYVTINKTSAGKANFSYSFHCETSNGTHTGTDYNILQDQ